MSIKEEKVKFESGKARKIYESTVLTFHGAEGFDVYNCSIPFTWDGKKYIYGRVEKRENWACSWVKLFEQSGKDEFTLIRNHTMYQMEDPYISIIQGEMILGGTHVRKQRGMVDTYYGYFYRGMDLNDLNYFTTGPDFMKDIRLVELEDGKIGVFSRPRSEEIRKRYGSSSIIGFTVIDTLDELTDKVILSASHIDGIFDRDEWGGCNQVYLLEDGTIGVIGHQCYSRKAEKGENLAVYVNISFEFDPLSCKVKNKKIIGTRSCYPDGPAKVPNLLDCTFTSGILMREDGKADLYAGMGDTMEGRITIDYPFSISLK